MMNVHRIATVMICVAALFGAQAYASAPQTESIEKTLIANWKQLKYLSATIKIQAEMHNKFGSVSSEGEGTFSIDRSDGKEKFYKHVKTEVTNDIRGKPLSTKSAAISVTIDDITQSRSDSVDKKYVIRKKATPIDRRDAPTMLAFLHKLGTVQLLPTQTLDGRKTYVFETKYDTPDSLITRMVVHFDDQTGVAVRITTYDINAMAVNISTLTIASVNHAPIEGLFDLPTTEGAVMVYLTKDEKVSPTE